MKYLIAMLALIVSAGAMAEKYDLTPWNSPIEDMGSGDSNSSGNYPAYGVVGGYVGQKAVDGDLPPFVQEKVDWVYDMYNDPYNTTLETASGERKAPSPWLNGWQHNMYYMNNNDSLAEGGQGDTPYRGAVTVTNAISTTVRTTLDQYGNAVTNEHSGRNFVHRIENTARRTARRFRKLF